MEAFAESIYFSLLQSLLGLILYFNMFYEMRDLRSPSWYFFLIDGIPLIEGCQINLYFNLLRPQSY